MNIKERLSRNEEQGKALIAKAQELDRQKQVILQEVLRFEGEHRLLLDLQKEEKSSLPEAENAIGEEK